MSETAYDLYVNGGPRVRVELDIDWDEFDFLSITVTDDEHDHELINIVSQDESGKSIDAFFAAADKAKAEWEQKKAKRASQP